MRISKADAESYVTDHFCQDFSKEQRRTIDIDSFEILNWFWQFQKMHPEIGVTLGGDLHQMRRSLLECHIGPYV